jgi:hypothetical protein
MSGFEFHFLTVDDVIELHAMQIERYGSVLATLGWSPNFAFHYTWLPRHVVNE